MHFGVSPAALGGISGECGVSAQGLRDCACLYRRSPFLSQLLPLIHRVLTLEPTLPVVTCVLRVLERLTKLLLRDPPPPDGGAAESGLQHQLRQQLRSLLPDVAGKLKVNNKALQTAATNCIATFLRCSPLDAVLTDLLPLKDKAPGYRKPLLEQLAKAVEDAHEVWAPQKALPLLLEAAQTAAADGNAGVRAAGAALTAAVSQRRRLDQAVPGAAPADSPEKQVSSDARRKNALPSKHNSQQPDEQQQQSPSASPAPPPLVSMRGKTKTPKVAKPSTAPPREATSASSQPPTPKTHKTGGAALAAGEGRRGGPPLKAACATRATRGSLGGRASCNAVAGFASAALWEAAAANTPSDAEAAAAAKAVLPCELSLQLEKASTAAERKSAYEALARWAGRRCECLECKSPDSASALPKDGVFDDGLCALRGRRSAALPLLAFLRGRMRGFRERTALLDELCLAALKAVLQGLLPGAPGALATPETPDSAVPAATEAPSVRGDAQPVASRSEAAGAAIDVGVVHLVMEPLAERLAEAKAGAEVQALASLLADCVGSPVPVVAQVSALLEAKASSACGVAPRLLSACTALVQSLFAKWGLSAFAPPKQFLLVLRQMLEPTKVSAGCCLLAGASGFSAWRLFERPF